MTARISDEQLQVLIEHFAETHPLVGSVDHIVQEARGPQADDERGSPESMRIDLQVVREWVDSLPAIADALEALRAELVATLAEREAES